jgi:PGF-CTERM motif protein
VNFSGTEHGHFGREKIKMWEYIILCVVGLLTVAYLIRRIVNTVSLREGDSPCGSCSMAGSCTMKKNVGNCE